MVTRWSPGRPAAAQPTNGALRTPARPPVPKDAKPDGGPPDLATQLKIYAEAVRWHPDNIGYRLNLSTRLEQLDRRQEALAVLVEGLALMPTNAELRLETIKLLERVGEPDTAAAYAMALARNRPEPPVLWWLQGELASSRGDHAAAVAIYREASRARPLDVGSRLRLTQSLRRLSRHEDAYAVLTDGLVLMPHRADLLIEQITTLRTLGRLDAAAAGIGELARYHPDHEKLPWLKGELEASCGNREAASERYAEALRANPQDVRCRLRLAASLRQLERYDDALAVVAEGLARMPGWADLLIEQIVLLRRSGRFDSAAAALDTLGHHHPDHPRRHRLQGELAAARGNYAAASLCFSNAIRQLPSDDSARLQLARSLEQVDRLEEALDVLADGLARTLVPADLMGERITMLQRSGNIEAAEVEMAALSRDHPDYPNLQWLQGELAMASGNQSAALDHYRADLARFPSDANRRVRLANRLLLVGLAAEAVALLQPPDQALQPERVARINLLMQLGRWDDADRELDRWPTESPRAEANCLRGRMQLALLRFDFAAARLQAHKLLALSPGDVSAAQALAQVATLTFVVEEGWRQLGSVPIVPAGSGRARLGGRRLRHSFGQLINEFRLRPVETAALAAAASLSGEEQARKAAAVLRRTPGSVGAALAFLIGMARAGRLGGKPDPGEPPHHIPRKLHQYWDREMPRDIEQLMDQAAAMNPRFAYQRWNDVSARQFLRTLGKRRILRAYREARHAAIRADVFRLAVLFAEGGVYLDADDRCVEPIETLLPAEARAVFYQEITGSIGNNFIAAAPRHPLIGAALHNAVKAVLEGATESAWLATGPGLLSRVVAAALAHERDLRLPGDMHMVPLDLFRRSVQACRNAGYKRSKRHWTRAV